MTETEVAVIGGGASGLMASIASALAGADTIILEHMDRVGKKILATGNVIIQTRCRDYRVTEAKTLLLLYRYSDSSIKKKQWRFFVRSVSNQK